MASKDSTEEEKSVWDLLKDEVIKELDQCRQELKEITLLFEQSQVEVNKLTQRNAAATAHLQQTHAHFDSLPRADIRAAYDSAIDAQQRLFVMRGQVEKLQNDQAQLNRYIDLLERVMNATEGGAPKGRTGRGSSGSAETLEMMIQAQEAERQRLSRQMHDGPAQALSNFILQTEIAMRLFDLDHQKARDELANMKFSATNTFQKVRDFIFELRPMMLDDLGIAPTVKRYVDALKEQTGIDTRISITGMERRLESYQEVMIFRAIQELLNNAVRHSQASQIKVHLDMSETNVRIDVEDNGNGFDTGTLAETSGMGIKVIRDRVELLGGFINVESVVGRGTKVVFQIPAITTSIPV